MIICAAKVERQVLTSLNGLLINIPVLTFLRNHSFNNRYVSMFKKIAFAASMVVVSLSSAVAFAAEESRSSIQISASIPSKVFHAQPRDPNFGKDEKMNYVLATGELTALRALYDVRHTSGGIGAYIEGGPQALHNGANNIPLTYTFNGVTLTGASQEVVTEAAAAGGISADLVITAAKPGDTQNGEYSATPVLIFDALAKAS